MHDTSCQIISCFRAARLSRQAIRATELLRFSVSNNPNFTWAWNCQTNSKVMHDTSCQIKRLKCKGTHAVTWHLCTYQCDIPLLTIRAEEGHYQRFDRKRLPLYFKDLMTSADIFNTAMFSVYWIL